MIISFIHGCCNYNMALLSDMCTPTKMPINPSRTDKFGGKSRRHIHSIELR